MNGLDQNAATPSPDQGQPAQPQPTQPVAQPNPIPGQSATPQLTPEEQKSLAYFQTKAQQETERRKALEKEFDDFKSQIRQGRDDYADFDFGADVNIQTPAYQPPAPPAQHQEVDLSDPNALAEFVSAKTTERVLSTIEQREAQKEAVRQQQAYKADVARANDLFTKAVNKYQIPEQLVRESMLYAQRFIPNDKRPGMASRRAELALEYIQKNMQVSYSTQADEAQKIMDQQKVEAAKLVQQPALASPGTAAPVNPYKKFADDLLPDDPDV